MVYSEVEDTNLNTFLHVSGLRPEDGAAIAAIAPVILPHLEAVTTRFYDLLHEEPRIAEYIEGRVDLLKKTHLEWLQGLFAGEYGTNFIRRQERIGEVHVNVRVPPLFVAASMSFLRAELSAVISEYIPDREEASRSTKVVLRLLDLCQYLIDRKYSETLMNNLGISQALLVRLQTTGKKGHAA